MSFVQGPFETSTHDLTKHAVEIVGCVSGEKGAVGLGEAASRLEEISHVQRPTGPIPLGIAHRVVANSVQYAGSPLAEPLERHGGSGPMQHLRLVWNVAHESTKLLVRCVLEGIVKAAGVDPVASFI